MQAWDENTIGASIWALAGGADSSSSNGSSSSSNRNSGKKKKRPRESKASPITIVITDPYSFRAKVHKFTGMPTPPASSTSEESERPPLPFKPRAQRGVINIPLTSTNSTYCCNLPSTGHLLDPAAEAHASNSMLQLPDFSENKASNDKFTNSVSVSLLFEELLEELERTENAPI